MKGILDKLKLLLLELEKEHGPMLIFALFLRGDSPDRWDLVVSAPWLDSGSVGSYKTVATKVQDRLNAEEIVQLSRVVILDADDLAVAFLQDSYQVPNGIFKDVENCEILSQRFNFTIRRAYLLRCIRA
jgi:predicted sugar kinase